MSQPRPVQYRFESAGLPSTLFRVASVRVMEALGEPFRAELTLAVSDPDADLAELLGRDATLSIERGSDARRVVGLVRHVEEAEAAGNSEVTVVVVPALYMLSMRRNTRMFQVKTAVEILETVLKEALGPYGRAFRVELNASYAAREYCIQYQETDLEFVHRIMEEEGIAYSFDHDGDVEVMVLRDENASYTELSSGAPVPFDSNNLEVTDVEPITAFQTSLRATTTSVVIGDWDWTRTSMPFSAEARSTDDRSRDRESYEYGEGKSLAIWDYDQGARAYQSEDSAQQTTIRKELHNRDRLVGIASSRVIAAAPGMIFELVNHPSVGLDGRYLMTKVIHLTHLDSGYAGDGGRYQNRFECIPFETPYRPDRKTAKPHIPGVQTAVVTGPAGEEIHVDEHGRIKVQFHWDRENPADETSSCWIRVQQPWAGTGWGFWYVPRIGMEVIVHFVDGDPDRPLVSGCVYNGTNLPPYPLPDEKTKSTIKSNSSLGGGGFNEFRFEDLKGQEEIFTHAEKDYNEVVENDHNTLVHHDQRNEVDNNQTQTIHHDQIETVHGNQEMTVDGNRTVTVNGNYDETVVGTETRHVVGDVSETFSSNENRLVTGNLTESIGSNETRTIGGNQTETVNGNLDLAIAGSSTHNIVGSLSQSVTGGIAVSTPAAYSLTAVGGLSITAAAGVTLFAPGGMTIAAPGGVTKIDSMFKWEGVKKLEVCSFAAGQTNLKLSFTGVKYEAVGLKAELKGVKAVVGGNEVETGDLALDVYVADMKAGAMEVLTALGIWV